MTDSQKLDLLLQKMNYEEHFDRLEERMGRLEEHSDQFSEHFDRLEERMGRLEECFDRLEERFDQSDDRIAHIELHLENKTDHNIQLLAENFIDLVNKLNQAIPAADKNLAYKVKVTYLIDEVNKLRENVEAIRRKIA